MDFEFMWAMHRKTDTVGFRHIREKGQNAILFLHFLTPAKIVVENEEIYLARNACIIYTPGIRHDYGAVSVSAPYENNFVTFKTNTTDFFANYNLPTNEPFYITNATEITHAVEEITFAAAGREGQLEEIIQQRIYELFHLLEDGLEISDTKSQREALTRQRFVALRGEIMINPKDWTVQKMAAACYLTRSRFSVVYKSFFGVSPSDDLHETCLEYAKNRLANSDDSIAEIATDCGYKWVESFNRMFGERTGMTPGQYRKSKILED